MIKAIKGLKLTLFINILLWQAFTSLAKENPDSLYQKSIALFEANPDKGALLAHQSAALAIEQENFGQAAKSLFLAGYIAEQQNQLLTATLRYLEAIHYFGTAGTNETEHVSALKNLGRIYRIAGRYESAIACYKQAIAINQSEAELAGLIYNIGYAWYSVNRYDSAIYHFQRSYDMAMQQGDWNRVANNLNYIGLAHLYAGNPSLASDYFHKILASESYLADKFPKKAAQSWHNLALTRLASGDSTQALEAFEKAIAIKTILGDSASLFTTYLDLGELHYLLGNKEASLAMLTTAETCYRSVVPDPANFKLFELLENTWAGTNQTKWAVYNAKLNQAWKDHWALHARLSNENLSYEVERIEQDFVERLAARQLREKVITGIWMALIVVVAGGILFYVGYARNKARKNREKELLLNTVANLTKAS